MIKLVYKNCVLVLLFVFVLIYVRNHECNEVNLYPKCIIYTITGYSCAGCGGLRAAHAVLNGDVMEAFTLNPLLFIYVLCIFIGLFLKKYFSVHQFGFANWFKSLWIQHAAILLIISYVVLRNLNLLQFNILDPH